MTSEEDGLTTHAQALPDPALVGRSRATDFYGVDDMLPTEERALRDRVRAFCDEVVVPLAAQSWEDAVLPAAVKEASATSGSRAVRSEATSAPG
jgi:glutaryl-CoA dehydrogenase